MLWRPDQTHLDTVDDACLWQRSTLGARARAWYFRLQPQGSDLTVEVGPRTVTAYADGRVAGHAVLDEEGSLAITVPPEFQGRGIEDRLVAQATRNGRVPVRW